MKYWQESMLADLISYLVPNENVLGRFLFGSFGNPEFHPDYWSDVDILIAVQDGKLEEFFPTIEWLTAFGKLYTYSQSAGEFKCTTRACFENFNRIDLLITTEGKLSEINKWTSVPFSSGARILFSRSKIDDEIANQNYLQRGITSAPQEQFLELVRRFRFKSMLAVYKVVRNDLHLAQDLVRDYSVLTMMLRDRATGTNIHSHGGIWNQYVMQLEATQQQFTSIGILDSIKASNGVFEKLALEWSTSYQENRQLLLNWIETAQAEYRSENPNSPQQPFQVGDVMGNQLGKITLAGETQTVRHRVQGNA